MAGGFVDENDASLGANKNAGESDGLDQTPREIGAIGSNVGLEDGVRIRESRRGMEKEASTGGCMHDVGCGSRRVGQSNVFKDGARKQVGFLGCVGDKMAQ